MSLGQMQISCWRKTIRASSLSMIVSASWSNQETVDSRAVSLKVEFSPRRSLIALPALLQGLLIPTLSYLPFVLCRTAGEIKAFRENQQVDPPP